MLKRNIITVLAVLFGFSILISTAFANEGAVKQKQEEKTYDVKLTKAISIDDIEEILLKNSEIEVTEFYNIDIVENRIYTGGYFLHPEMDIKEAIKDYRKQYYHALMQGIETLENRIMYIEDSELKASAKQILEDTKIRKNRFLDGESIKVKSLRISGNEDQINSFKEKNSTKINNIEEITKKNKEKGGQPNE